MMVETSGAASIQILLQWWYLFGGKTFNISQKLTNPGCEWEKGPEYHF